MRVFSDNGKWGEKKEEGNTHTHAHTHTHTEGPTRSESRREIRKKLACKKSMYIRGVYKIPTWRLTKTATFMISFQVLSTALNRLQNAVTRHEPSVRLIIFMGYRGTVKNNYHKPSIATWKCQFKMIDIVLKHSNQNRKKGGERERGGGGRIVRILHYLDRQNIVCTYLPSSGIWAIMSGELKIGSKYNHVACTLSHSSMISWVNISFPSHSLKQQNTVISNASIYLTCHLRAHPNGKQRC